MLQVNRLIKWNKGNLDNSMFTRNITTSAISGGYNQSADSKYTVAEILSSMNDTDQVPITPTTLASGIFSSSGSFSGTTPTLTPTTLHNIEQSFMQYQPVAGNVPISHSNQHYGASGILTQNTEGGFVTPVIEPVNTTPTPVMVIKSEQDDFYYDDSSSRGSDEYSVGGKRRKNEDGSYVVPNIDPNTYLVANSRRPTGPRKERTNEPTSEEDKDKLQQRRQRNKMAAAKCRQRREDHTNLLIQQTEGLEEEKASLENEIQTLQQQKDQLEFILQAHRTSCRVAKNGQLVRSTLGSVMVQPTTASVVSAKSFSSVEPHTSSMPAMSSASFSHIQQNSSRPNSLPIVAKSGSLAQPNPHQQYQVATSITEATGVAINTPSHGVLGAFNFGLDTIAEGHTGLTPLTGVPTTLPLPVALQSCSGEVQKRRSTDSSSSNEVSSPNLITL